ncbi:DUF1272 domain-containing protein [Marinomonas transparens]|uniref:DUF1272 domain-containing protein n=1 Tax=Marinomonas transparens TaxID=2795388 RepID=A0A934JS40_9GAMM|nr:DUF1272 domain-containing protein [Marinomonas transparens]MBJ7539683.1 DUF1272 domain-containing protein [Marinomonas transparens]
MLDIRPNCECCDKDLPTDSTEAMICSYECTFCRDCVADLLNNVCPNCGGGFSLRPVRPRHSYRDGVSVIHQPASEERVHTRYSTPELQSFSDDIKHISPAER